MTTVQGEQPAQSALPSAPVVLNACTVATRAELPAVRVLSTSFLAAHPQARFVSLLVDADHGTPSEGILAPADIGVEDAELAVLATACTAAQLCAMLRPRLLEWLVAHGGPALYLDPWVLVLASVAEQVLPAVARQPVVLVPRVFEALPDDGLRPAPEEMLAAGAFDPGFLAVAPGAEGFLRSWAEQIRRSPSAAGGFLDGASALVDHHVLRDPGIGLSAWNAAQRPLKRDESDRITAAGELLRTVHFTGFDPQRPWLFSADFADRPRVLLSEHPVLTELCASYRSDLVRAGHGVANPGYGFAVLPVGEPPGAAEAAPRRGGGGAASGVGLPDALRAEYLHAWQAASRKGLQPPPPAFGDAPAAFLSWACAPGDEQARGAGVSRWAAAVWRDDPFLRQQFPDPFGANAEDFREWCAGAGVSTGRVHPDAVTARAPEGSVLLDQLGVSVLGSGEEAELFLAAAKASGLPMSDRPGYPVVVHCEGAGPVPKDRYVIAVRDDVQLSSQARPAAGPSAVGPNSAGIAAAGLVGVEELWVQSESTRLAVERPGAIPVHVIPPPVLDPGEVSAADRAAARELLGSPVGPLFVAEADHADERGNNAVGLVAAFLGAFREQDVHLVVVVVGARDHPEAAERLRLATAADQRITLIEDAAPERRRAVLDAADCVVSLHRGDGGGSDRVALRLASAAARGLPVLATGYGTVAELLTADVAALVPCHPGTTEPDAQAAIRLLRAVADDVPTVAKIGAAGREHVLNTRSLGRVAGQLRERVEHAYRGWRARRFLARPSENADPLRPLKAARHALLRQPDVDGGSRALVAPTLRKAVLRVLGPYDNHLREVLTSLVDGVERTATELVRRQDDMREGTSLGELDVLRAELGALAERQARLGDHLVGTDGGVVRARAELAVHGRRIEELDDALADEAAERGDQVNGMAERLDRLTVALNRTLDRIDSLESRVAAALRERDTRMDSGLHAAATAIRTTDALRRVIVRQHERHDPGGQDPDEEYGAPTSLVLCDAGLMRLPASDDVMLPLLSSNGVWEPEVSALIDSLLEPDGVFVDVGAYVGYQTVRVLSRLGATGAVVAVEPYAPACTLLRRNVEVNVSPSVARRLVVLESAAWDSSCDLATEPARSGGVSVHPVPAALTPPSAGATAGASANDIEPPAGEAVSGDASGAAGGDAAGEVPGDGAEVGLDQGVALRDGGTVPACRLDRALEALPELGQLRLSVVKVDVPGRAHRALGGLVRLLRRDRPHVVCSFSVSATAALGDDPSAVLREFSTWGYEPVLLGEQRPASPEQLLDAAKSRDSIMLWLQPRERLATDTRTDSVDRRTSSP